MNGLMALEIALAAIVAALAVVLEHYWVPSEAGRVKRYVLGVLSIHLPVSALLAAWGLWWALVGLWAITGAAGLGTVLCYGVDHWKDILARLRVSEREGHILRSEVRHGENE